MHMSLNKLQAVAALCFLGGCSSINSIPDPSTGANPGLAYYLPKKDFIITIVKANGQFTSVTLAETPAYPDVAKSFVLQFQENPIGKNVLNIGIGTNGLLTSSKSVTTSGVTDALKNLGDSIGSIAGLAAPAAAASAVPAPNLCAKDGTHIFNIKAGATTATPCGFSVSVVKRATAAVAAKAASAAGVGVSGIFYRQAEPYEVTVTGPINTYAVLFSPSLAPVQLLPIARTLFSNNDADFGFTDGMPTKYNQSTDGELIALFKLPADVIGAYFGAVGRTFDSFKSTDSKQAEVLAASIKLELAKRKYDLCLAAIQARDNALVQQLDCAK